MNPSDDKDIVKYKTDNALDSDVIATQKHFKAEEKQQGHNFDPVKFLAQTKDQDMDYTYENGEQMAQHEQMANEEPQAALGDLASAPQLTPVTAIAQEKAQHKSAVKSKAKAKVQAKAKTEAKTKAQTHAEKMNAFVSMRKKMMSNWGTK
jgi:hypothetical protein